jgi:hypothetical protein
MIRRVERETAKTRGGVALLLACLLLLRLLAPVSYGAIVAVGHDSLGATATEIDCLAFSQDGKKAPTPARHHNADCALCASGSHVAGFDRTGVSGVSTPPTLPPRSSMAAWTILGDRVVSPVAWRGPRRSRAPPVSS